MHDADDAVGNVSAAFVVCGSDFTVFCTGYGSISATGTFAAPVNDYIQSDLSGLGLVVNKFAFQYSVHIVLSQLFDATAFRQVNVYYRLQVSDPPVTPTFGDVPTSYLYYKAIEALAASGITSGCGSGNFCPGGTVTRGEMAAFLARALGLHFPN